MGSGYAGGAIGSGKALPGKNMASKQDCCDACERDPRCAKFVFEHYGGDCQMFGPQAEKYFTFNLLSGTVDSRVSQEEEGLTRVGGEMDSDTAPGMGGGWESSDDLSRIGSAPPIPPDVFDFGFRAPPAPQGDPSEGGVAKRILADFSLGIGFLILVVFSLFAYLFFAQDINKVLYTYSNGRLGKRPRSLLPTQEPTDGWMAPVEHGKGTKKKKAPEPGWAKVTVQTSQVTQKKDVQVSGCESLDDLRELIWDDFGHLLKTVRKKDMVLLVWTDEQASDELSDADHTVAARWELINDSSDMTKVTACTEIKLAEKKAYDLKSLSIAFTARLGDGQHRRRKNTTNPHSTRKANPGRNRAAPTADDDSDTCSEEDGRDGLPLVAKDDDDDDERAHKSARARGAVNGRKAGRNAKHMPGTGQTRGSAVKSGAKQDSDDEDVAELVPSRVDTSLVGKLVEVHGLVSKTELNGRSGIATSFDKAKSRYRVRLKAGRGQAEQVLGFKPENIRLTAITGRELVLRR